MCIWGFQTIFVCFYEGGSKLSSYVTMSGVQNFPCMLQRGGSNPPCKFIRGGFITTPQRFVKSFRGGFKPPLYLPTREVYNLPQIFVNIFREGFKLTS